MGYLASRAMKNKTHTVDFGQAMGHPSPHSRSKRPSEYKFKGRVGIAADQQRKVCTQLSQSFVARYCELTIHSLGVCTEPMQEKG